MTEPQESALSPTANPAATPAPASGRAPLSPTEPAPRGVAALVRKLRAWPERELRPHLAFWIGFTVILGAAAILRSFRLDMPPLDFPADRQRSNMLIINGFLHGGGLFSNRGSWLELWILPWLTARTWWIGRLFSCQLWTVARFWSALAGVVTVGMAALAGYWAAATPGAPEARRRRIALLWMGALAFNPYHLTISHMISTESVTLALQMCAVAFFFVSQRHPRRIGPFALFVLFFMLSGWAKIPSLIWLPGFFLYFIFRPATRLRTRVLGVAIILIGMLAVFAVYRINPFGVLQSFGKKYSFFAQYNQLWLTHRMWLRGFIGRTVLMLTLPGALLALAGLLTAPWLFRITTGAFVVLFYGLLTLNLYNYCHIIIPGMALAAWGANALIEAAGGDAFTRLGPWRGWPLDRWQRPIKQGIALVLMLILIAALYPLGPQDKTKIMPRGEVLQGVEVIRRLAPKPAAVYNDDIDGSLALLTGAPDTTISNSIDLRSGYFYSIDRFAEKTFNAAASAWVRWASLPGEPAGILYGPTPAASSVPDQSMRLAVPPANPAPALAITSLLLPAKQYDPKRQALIVQPGTTLRIGIGWKNDNQTRLAALRWYSKDWKQYVPVPLREGGFSIMGGGVLCVPEGRQSTAWYTFEIPAGFPPGLYPVNYYPQLAPRWTPAVKDFTPLPLNILCVAPAAPKVPVEQKYSALYPLIHDRQPFVWSERWFYRNMKLEGYYAGNEQFTHLFACAQSKPGVYELTVRGDGTPVTSAQDPGDVWPYVDVYLPSDREKPVARLPISALKTREFRVTFTAYAPFNSLLLKASAQAGSGAEPPLWMLGFSPGNFGKQFITLRGAKLELKRELFAK